MFFFLQMVVGVLCHAGVGRSYLQIEKDYVQLEKVKAKNGTMYRLKNKN